MIKSLYPARLFFVSCCFAMLAAPAHAEFYVDDGAGGTYNVKPKHTFLDMRYYRVYRQRFDFSCGSAALASLLTFNYERPSDEGKIIRTMYTHGDHDKIRKEGFSLLDMKNYLQSIGLRSNGYREGLDKLSRVGIPAIVLINRKGYLHFVVVEGVTKDKVLFGDPALGKKIMPRKQFEAMWSNHILFVVEDEIPKARKGFNTNMAWHVRKPAKFDMPMPNEDLANFTLLTSFQSNSFRGN